MFVGVDIGGTKILAAVVTPQGEILAREKRATMADEGPEAVISRLIGAIEAALSLAGTEPARLAAIGIAVAGMALPGEGVVAFSPNLRGWRDVPLRDIVARQLGVSTFLINDASAAALGEHCYGAGRGVNNLVYVTVGTGIGGGVIIDGKLYCGACGVAGEVGHMTIDVDGPRCNCGNFGCLEALASGTAVAREAKRHVAEGAETCLPQLVGGELEMITAETVFQAAQKGDPLALEIIAQAASYLGIGLANLVNLFNPELIIVGGGLAHMGNMLLSPALRVIRERAFEVPAQAVRLVTAQLGGSSGVLGAVAFALQQEAEVRP